MSVYLRRMRRIALCAVASLSMLAAACGDDDTASSETRITAPAGGGASTTSPATPSAIPKPEVVIPASIPTELVATVLTPGDGRPAASGDTVVVHYVGVRTENGEEFDNSYDTGTPLTVTLGRGSVIAGWDQGLVGAKTGSRLQLDIPNELAYRDEDRGVIKPGDALTFVIDVLAVVAPTTAEDQPDLEPMRSSDATELGVEDLVDGDGKVVEAGDTALVHAIIIRGDTGEQVDNTWEGGTPLPLALSEGQTLGALVDGLPGMKVGGRRALTVPPELGLGQAGMSGNGLPPDIDLIFVIDVLAAYR